MSTKIMPSGTHRIGSQSVTWVQFLVSRALEEAMNKRRPFSPLPAAVRPSPP